MLLPSLCLPAFAAGIFPYDEFEKEGYHYQLRHSSDYDTERGEVLYPQGLMLKEHFEYKGYQDGSGRNHPLYEQNAVATIRIPDSFTDDLGTIVYYSPDWFTTYGHDSFRENFSYEGAGQVMTRYNAVSYHVSHEAEIAVLTPENRSQTVEEAIEKKVEYWKAYFQGTNQFGSDTNQAEEPVAVQKNGNATVLIGREEHTNYKDKDNSLNAVKVYGFTSSLSYSYSYRIYYAVPELKGVFFEVRYIEKGSYSEQIEDKNQGEYQKYITAYEKLVNDHKDKQFAQQLINLGSLLSVTWEDPVISEEYNGAVPEETKQNAGVTQNAEETPGEDGGVSVPAAIVIGVLGGGAAIAGAAAASGGSDDKKKKRKAYKLYVQKDFGDAIRRGGDKPVKIRARMAEVEGTTERDRNDLTALITVSADGMTVHGAALAGRYCEVTVSVPENNQNDTANITFTFMGEGGSFTNTVIFRIVDGPQLKFVDERDGTLYHENCGIDAIPGDGFTYTERFAIVDAPTAPKLSDISAVNTGEFDVEFALTDQPALYQMTVKNNTNPDSEHDIFAKPVDKNFEIHVNVEGEKEPVKGYVTVTLYPEGITVSSTMEGKKNDVKYVRVQAYEKEYAGDLDKKWQVSEIKFTLAVKGEDRAIIDPKEAEYKFDKLKGAGGKGTTAAKEQTIAEKYEYKESWGDWNGKFTYTFEPQDRLWEPDNGTFFVTLLPVNCDYDGATYKGEIPIRLKGKEIDPMEAWEKEYEKTRERIEKFSLPEQKAYNLQQLEKIASSDTFRISTWELRLMSKDIVRAYMKYWTEQHEKDQWTADALDWAVWGLDWVKWIGDCAFSFVVAAYTGPMEAIITPAKDVLVNAIGEVGVNIVWGTKFDVKNLEIYDQIKNAGDNFVSGGVADGVSWLASSGMSSPAKIKYACAIMGGYFVFAVFNNYLLSLEKGENDFYGAIMGAFKDMTVTALKIAASMMFKKWLESESFKKKIGPKLEEFMQKWFGEHLTDQKFNLEKMYNDSQQLYGDLALKDSLLNIDVEITKSGIVEKYLSELFGVGGAWVSDNPDKAMGFWLNASGAIMFSFTLPFQVGAATLKKVIDVDIMKVLSDTANGMFTWFYDNFFGGLPAADALMEIPKDPPLPPEKN